MYWLAQGLRKVKLRWNQVSSGKRIFKENKAFSFQFMTKFTTKKKKKLNFV